MEAGFAGSFDVLGPVVDKEAFPGGHADMFAYMLVNMRFWLVHFQGVGIENLVEKGFERGKPFGQEPLQELHMEGVGVAQKI